MTEVRRILQHALPGKNSNVQRRIERAERLERIIFNAFGYLPGTGKPRTFAGFSRSPPEIGATRAAMMPGGNSGRGRRM